MNQSSISMARVDEVIMENPNTVIDPKEYMMIVANDLCTPLEQIWRVKLLDNDEIELSDFTLARKSKNFISTRCLNNVDIPKWIVDKIAVLQIVDDGEQVKGVGQKVSDKVFYVIE